MVGLVRFKAVLSEAMKDDRDGAPPHRARPQSQPAVERIPRWTLFKGGLSVEAFARTTSSGPEIQIASDGKLVWSHGYRGMDPSLCVAATAKRHEFEANGWVVR